jgi:hypothetical protein
MSTRHGPSPHGGRLPDDSDPSVGEVVSEVDDVLVGSAVDADADIEVTLEAVEPSVVDPSESVSVSAPIPGGLAKHATDARPTATKPSSNFMHLR